MFLAISNKNIIDIGQWVFPDTTAPVQVYKMAKYSTSM